jgi:uncharacterized delta-60 repeat protein
MKFLPILLLFYSNNILAQYLNIDPNFGIEGVARANFNSGFEYSVSALHLASGKILIAGKSKNPVTGKNDLILAQYHGNGLLDNSFGTQGKSRISFGQRNLVSIGELERQDDGKILIPGSADQSMVLRILPNGLIDNQFGQNGIFYGNQISIIKILVLPNKKLICLGNMSLGVSIGPVYRLYSLRLDSIGHFDSSYSSNIFGFKFYTLSDPQGSDYMLHAYKNSSNGLSILYTYGSPNLLFFKLDEDGLSEGPITGEYLNCISKRFPSDSNNARIVTAKNGGYFLSGNIYTGNVNTSKSGSIIKLKSDGQIDSTFGNFGLASFKDNNNYSGKLVSTDMFEDSSGKIWAANYVENSIPGQKAYAVTRFLPTGKIDSSYGNGDGILQSNFSGNPKRIFMSGDGFPIVIGSGLFPSSSDSIDLVAIKMKPTITTNKILIKNYDGIYPSIVESGSKIFTTLSNPKDYEYSLIQASGRSLKLELDIVDGSLTLPKNGLVTGLYLIRFISESKQFTNRIFIK